MHIRLDINELTLDDLETLEGVTIDPDQKKWTQVKQLLSHFCYESEDEDAEKIDSEEALKRVGKIKLSEIEEITGGLREIVESVASLAVPPPTEEPSSSPSEE
jgi:hypothetical protein